MDMKIRGYDWRYTTDFMIAGYDWLDSAKRCERESRLLVAHSTISVNA